MGDRIDFKGLQIASKAEIIDAAEIFKGFVVIIDNQSTLLQFCQLTCLADRSVRICCHRSKPFLI